MLKKLFKHDMRSVAGIIFSLSLLVLGTTIVGTIAAKLSFEIEVSASTIGLKIIQILLVLISGISYIAVGAFGIIVEFIVLSRFYKNFFTDQGYLTFTLPVKTSSLLLSKFFMTAVWSLYDTAVVMFCVGILNIFGTAPKGKLVNLAMFEEIKTLFNILFQNQSTRVSIGFFIAEVVLVALLAAISSIWVIFLSITIGSIIAKKLKLLAAFGFYYLLNNVVSAIATASFFIYFIVITEGSSSMFENGSIHVFMVSIMLFLAAVSTIEYFICRHLIKNKLNLA